MPTVSFDIVGYDTTDYSWYSQSNIANAYDGSDSTSYATINYKRGSGAETWVYFEFNTSSIPSNATINSVTCSVKCLTNGNATILPTRTVQMFTGTTAKGSASSMPTSAGTRTFSGETWTVAELRDARVKVYAQRGTTQVNTNYYCRIYGATLTVDYTPPAGPSYTVKVKNNGSWVDATKVLVKSGGSWVEASNVLAKDNGSWK